MKVRAYQSTQKPCHLRCNSEPPSSAVTALCALYNNSNAADRLRQYFTGLADGRY